MCSAKTAVVARYSRAPAAWPLLRLQHAAHVSAHWCWLRRLRRQRLRLQGDMFDGRDQRHLFDDETRSRGSDIFLCENLL